MSNVLRRNRAFSDVSYLHNASRIRAAVTSLVMNEKAFPKRYRFIYSIPCIDICRELISNANSYYNCQGEDDDLSTLYERKINALMNMQDCCRNLLSEFQSAREILYIKMSAYENVVGLIVDEEGLINNLIDTEKEKHTNFLKNNLKKELV